MFTLGSLFSRAAEALTSEDPGEAMMGLGSELRRDIHAGIAEERERRERLTAGEILAEVDAEHEDEDEGEGDA